MDSAFIVINSDVGGLEHDFYFSIYMEKIIPID